MSKILSSLLFVLAALHAWSQNADRRYTDYIERWRQVAIEQQAEHGIPASITLAQGLLESAAGTSRLATEGNNHFGIKCHRDWQGDTMLRDDDAKNECFRVYDSAEESFIDHSRFLLRKRYEPLFLLDVNDYKAWANGLKQCGYATDPNYARRLISIIERYSLYLYDNPDYKATADDASFIIAHLQSIHTIAKTRSLHYVIANPGDTYAKIAAEFSIPLEQLLTFNDMTSDTQIRPWQEVYLQEKHSLPPDEITTIVIGEDENIHSIAQRLAMKIEAIHRLNPDACDTPGTLLHLR